MASSVVLPATSSILNHDEARSDIHLFESFDATIRQRGHIFELLISAEREAKDALLNLYLVEQELELEQVLLTNSLKHVLDSWGRDTVYRLIKTAELSAKTEWQEQWDFDWFNSDDEAEGLAKSVEPLVEVPTTNPSQSQRSQRNQLPTGPPQTKPPQASNSGTSRVDELSESMISEECQSVSGETEHPSSNGYAQRLGPSTSKHTPPPPKRRRPRRLQRKY